MFGLRRKRPEQIPADELESIPAEQLRADHLLPRLRVAERLHSQRAQREHRLHAAAVELADAFEQLEQVTPRISAALREIVSNLASGPEPSQRKKKPRFWRYDR